MPLWPVPSRSTVRAEITVHVCRSPAARQTEQITLVLPEGCTVLNAVYAAGWAEDASQAGTVAVWGRRVSPEHVLRAGDRIEILRCLQVDPKTSRRLRYHAQAQPRKQPR